MEIPLDRFEQEIDERILERGLKYFERGAVEEPEELEPGLYEAVVQGSEDYTVSVRLKGNAVTGHACDCPYEGPVCKHVVALLFELQQGEMQLPKRGKGSKAAKKPTVAEQVDRALSGLPHKELTAFVRDRCLADAVFRKQFLVACAPQAITGDRKDHLKSLRAGLRAVAGRGGFFGWNETFAAAAVLHDMVDQARTLIKKGHPQGALPMISAAIEAGAEAMEHADDSNGDIGGGIEAAMDLLDELAQAEHEEPFRKELLAETVRLLADERVNDCDWNGHLQPAAAALARTEAEAAPLMATLKRSADVEYGGATARTALLQLTRRFQGAEAATTLEERFLVHSEVRQAAIERAIKAKDWKRARQLAEDGRLVRINGRTVTHEHYWTPHLLRIAQLTKDTPEVIRLARTLMLDGTGDGMEHYKLLRKHVAVAEWPAYLEQLLNDLRKAKGNNRALLADICAAEERWNEVMDIAREEGRDRNLFYYHSVLDQYETELAKHFKDEVTTTLAERAEAYASKTNPKHHDYVDATKLLRRVRKLGGQDLVAALSADWRERLKRRKGLMEELGKL
ncbi:MAG: SWIM zinc finger family protein [Bacteroidetes bacterium]|nr:SWIM zinc finger family protein [Bacteroidota bacterium]